MAGARSGRRGRHNKGRFSALFKLMAIAALVAAMTMGATVFFQLEQVEVVGNVRYTAQEVETASGLLAGDNLFHLNKSGISKEIRETLPYVEGVNIVRRLPSTIVITVNECDAVAKVEPFKAEVPEDEVETESTVKATQPWLISIAGKLLEPAPEDSAAIEVLGLNVLGPREGAILTVPQVQQEKQAALLEILRVLQERESVGRVSQIDLTSNVQVRLRYDGRFWVKLPLVCDFSYKLNALETVIAQRGTTERGTMDLTREEYTVIFSPE